MRSDIDWPKAVEAEESLLSSVLVGDYVLPAILEILKPEDFYIGSNQIIFKAMLDLFQKSEPVDPVTVGNVLKAKGQLETVGGYSYLAQLNGEVPVAVNAPHYARLVKSKAILRGYMKSAWKVFSDCQGPDADPLEVGQAADAIFAEVATTSNTVTPIGEIVPAAVSSILHRSAGHDPGIKTGIPRLDWLTGGLQKSDLIIMAARPGVGKSALALNIALHAVYHGHPTLFFSLEMSSIQLVRRGLAGEAGLSLQAMRDGRVSDRDAEKIQDVGERLQNLPLYLDESGTISVPQIRAKCKRLAAKKGLGLVVVDYVQLIQGPKEDRRDLVIGAISRGLKALAKELNIPVLALAQINRSNEKENRKPRISDLRESGSLEQDADVIGLLHAEGEAEPGQLLSVELNLAKHRNGSRGKVELWFEGETTTFREKEKTR